MSRPSRERIYKGKIETPVASTVLVKEKSAECDTLRARFEDLENKIDHALLQGEQYLKRICEKNEGHEHIGSVKNIGEGILETVRNHL